MANLHSHPSIVLFDGVCNLCNGAVQFIILHDPKGQFQFASLQSSIGQDLLKQYQLPTNSISTIVLIEQGRSYIQSTAALRIARRLRGAWPLLYAAILVPPAWRNVLYRWVARNRYRWFGKTEQCMLPNPAYKQRFLE
jgi:predicted DCC family thiol-disulfide oxidoreductase YuxK